MITLKQDRHSYNDYLEAAEQGLSYVVQTKYYDIHQAIDFLYTEWGVRFIRHPEEEPLALVALFSTVIRRGVLRSDYGDMELLSLKEDMERMDRERLRQQASTKEWELLSRDLSLIHDQFFS